MLRRNASGSSGNRFPARRLYIDDWIHGMTATQIASKRALSAALTAVLLFLTGARYAQTVTLNIQTGVQVSWQTSTNTTYTYRAQWAPYGGGSWTDLVAPMAGDGAVHSYYDAVAPGTRIYQLLE